MERKIEAFYGVEIYVNENKSITIRQEYMGEESIVDIDPHHVDTVIKWLAECKEEALKS